MAVWASYWAVNAQFLPVSLTKPVSGDIFLGERSIARHIKSCKIRVYVSRDRLRGRLLAFVAESQLLRESP